MKIGKTLKLIRIIRGLKQKELAKRLGISPNYLSSVENAKREPSLSFIKLVSKELDVPVSFLFLDNIDEESMPEEQRAIYQKLKSLLVEFQSLKTNNANGKIT
jgi:transcriptional regulator with XRE-family HTH domain